MKKTADLESGILGAMQKYFNTDIKRIRHARKVLGYAKEIMETEGGSYDTVTAAAILHDIGIKECERKYGSTNGQLQEKEGPPIARRILEDLGVNEKIVSDVCRIIASHHSPGEVDTLEFRIIWDSDWLVNLKDEYDTKDNNKLNDIIDKVFLTKTGKAKAKGIYLHNEKE